MKRIGISARLDEVQGRCEERDALDVRWATLLWSLGYLPLPLCSGVAEVTEYLEALSLDGFILSGGNDIGSAPARDRLELGVLDYSSSKRLPVLGVCRGMQFINYYCGGDLIVTQGHVNTRHSLSGHWAEENGLLAVNSFHKQSIISTTLSSSLTPLAQSADGVIEALRHRSLPWLGIMWHPEREKPIADSDLALLKNHFDGK
ncbi:putative glutamine amidotransferase [Marinobacter daqiaonensis]|uniref:Putative glutamine amidotransferase n=1 Tax=Marinobacter daqiaonensis TaxID=650891 RepID=A0A1I6H9D7_9GAMM|nr:gamma-glutamyl-gamma-aminobutyrate hydrolase family protein [Marinobacter daqiaonensis]SFR51105.1 putative glutamine amidotransferase [Marinobacter daqiaonensis]